APQIRSPRTRRVSEETRAALRYLGELGSIGNNINQATRRLHEAHKTEIVGEQQYREMSSQLDELRTLLSEIRRDMVGADQ
ncbi:plasmid mobilization relaxosome protein MobC, partial [Roseivivax halotolerans]|uniref:plasmid mobilization relaxosome protein MobC n=1 Tax=Roseivivax halotolerans TaxID=93684 RepID=UPI0011139A67